MTSTLERPTTEGTDTGSGGFPAELFTIRADPAAIRGSVTPYRTFASAADGTAGQLKALSLQSWQGTEGDVFRSRRDQFVPTMTTAHQSFSLLGTRLDTFADQVQALKDKMAEVRARAEAVWSALQAAKAAQVQAQAGLTAAAAAVPVSGGNPATAAALAQAENTYAQAYTRVSQLASQWEECLADARKIKADLTSTAQQTAAAVRALPLPPSAPGASAGGASATTMNPVALNWAATAQSSGGPAGAPFFDASRFGDLGEATRDVINGAATALQWPINANNVYTLMTAWNSASNILQARRGLPWKYATIDALAEVCSKSEVAQALKGASSATADAAEAAKRLEWLDYAATRKALTPLEQMERASLARNVPHMQINAAQLTKSATTLNKIAPYARGLGRAVGVLAVVDDAATIVKPWDRSQGVLPLVDKGAAAVNGALTVAALSGAAVPVVGQVALVGTGVYLAGRWAYDNNETFHKAVDSTVDFASKKANEAWEGAKNLGEGAKDLGKKALGWIKKW